MNAITIKLRIWGDFACFTAPEMRVERVSYPVMTPSAARGVLEAIFWKPQIRYEVDEIAVLKPIHFVSVRRNEIQGTITVAGNGGVKAWMKDQSKFQPYLVDSAGRDDVQGENRTQRNSVILRDAAYRITARLIIKQPTAEDNPQKYRRMFFERAESGQCFRQPCLGIREYAAHFALSDGSEQPVPDTRSLGNMLYDLDFPENVSPPGTEPPRYALFAPAELKNGVLNVCAMREKLFRRVKP
jgi:CRISPR-associated protein Cas5d